MKLFSFQDTSNQSLILIWKLCKIFWIFKKFTCSLNRELREVHLSIYMSDYFACFHCIFFNFSLFISLFCHFSEIFNYSKLWTLYAKKLLSELNKNIMKLSRTLHIILKSVCIPLIVYCFFPLSCWIMELVFGMGPIVCLCFLCFRA